MSSPVKGSTEVQFPCGDKGGSLRAKLQAAVAKPQVLAVINEELKESAALALLARDWPEITSWADGNGCTLVAYLAELGWVEHTEVLLQAGAEVNAADKTGWTPLYRACSLADPAMMELLFRYQANPNLRCKDGSHSTPLHRAAARGNVAAVKCLLRNGGDPSLVNVLGTPLHYAAKGGYGEIVAALIEGLKLKGSILVVDPSLFLEPSPYALALDGGHATSAELLSQFGMVSAWHLPEDSELFQHAVSGSAAALDAQAISTPDKYGFTLLHYAAFLDKPELIAEALDRFPGMVDQKDGKGRTALDYAARGGHLQAIEKLLEYHASPSSQDGQGYHALFWAAHFGKGSSVEVVECLLRHDRALSELTDQFGWTPLHKAAETRQERICELLLNAIPHAMVNAKSNGGETPLHRAAMSGSESIVRLLIDRGADKSLPNLQGKLPRDFATSDSLKALL